MNHKILTWNVRRLNEVRKRLKIRNLLSKWKVDIACLQETKLELIPNQLVQSLWRCPYVDWWGFRWDPFDLGSQGGVEDRCLDGQICGCLIFQKC
jgi:hypothetical protein